MDYIYSENTCYKPSSKGHGKFRHHFLYLDPRVREYKDIIKRKAITLIDIDLVPSPDNVIGLVTEYRIGIPKDTYWKRDITNTIKPIEDAIFELLKENNKNYDDKYVVSNFSTKILTKEDYFIDCQIAFLMDSDNMRFLMNVPTLKFYLCDIGI